MRATAEAEKNLVVLSTMEDVAVIRKNITVNQAIGESQAKLLKAKAEALTFQTYEVDQASAYKELITSLSLTPEELIDYI